jgi:FkbM family methyltransferase
LLAPYLPPNPVIVEAGAHIGTDTEEFSRRWPEGTVHAFEPVPTLYRQLVSRTRRRRNVFPWPLALGTTDGAAELHVSGGGWDASSSLLEPQAVNELPGITFEETIVVPVVTLDSWALASHNDHVDMLWLDMQGTELNALKAAPKVVASVSVLVLEVFTTQQYAGAPLWADVRSWLLDNGFDVKCENFYWRVSGNVLAVRSRPV